MAYETRRPLFNFSGVLAADISPTDTTISAASGLFSGLPTDYSSAIITPLTVSDDAAGKAEEVFIVGHAQGASSVTVVRGREGTTPQSFKAGDVIRCSPTPSDTQRIGGHAGMTGSFVSNVPAPGKTVPLTGQDLYGGVTVANNAIKAPVAGLWRCTYHGYFSGGSGYMGYLKVQRNGADDALFPIIRITKADANDYSNSISVQRRLAANDALSLVAFASAGSFYGSNGYDGCYLELELIQQQ